MTIDFKIHIRRCVLGYLKLRFMIGMQTVCSRVLTATKQQKSCESKHILSSTGRDQSSLCDTLLSVCPSVRPSVRLSVRKQFLLSHLLWGYLSQRLLYSHSLLALWCSCAPAIVIMILSPGALKGGVAIFPKKVYVNLVITSPLRLFVSDT